MYKDPTNKISSNRVSYLDFWYLETGCKIEKLFKVSAVVLLLVNLFSGQFDVLLVGSKVVGS
ncbi:hypothetical protein BCT90_08890 [Vibrio lentus]|uniref:Uncharacterized protein n=1 Tax=Vibrio lentus TaxID=136468 RepID=A0A2N7BJB5_9VIBR|nr:hypothetical protein BCV34_09715 [Vibrio lentus]PME56724.1 hypothetical protein BCV30_18605 [Vibrio lentus]PME93996.1 hypothetical protein BCV27_20915 [Vibrio lentus]PMH94158.1 hypothetical protein BCU56_20495 [Vibrio lentus]PMI05921.1 hypothetical protein BCU53_13635 [Vibrio lentus]